MDAPVSVSVTVFLRPGLYRSGHSPSGLGYRTRAIGRRLSIFCQPALWGFLPRTQGRGASLAARADPVIFSDINDYLYSSLSADRAVHYARRSGEHAGAKSLVDSELAAISCASALHCGRLATPDEYHPPALEHLATRTGPSAFAHHLPG